MSDANLAALARRRTGTTQYKALRYTAEDFKFNKETAQSQEIRDDGQIPDLAKVGGQPEGGFNFELSFLAQQPELASILRAEWLDIAIGPVSTTLDAGTQLATAAAGTFDDVPVGALLKIAGATTPGNNGPKRVVAKAVDGSTVTFAAGSIVTTDAAANLTITGKTLINGVDVIKHDFEKRVVNAAKEDFFLQYNGMVADTIELQIESKRIVTGSIKYIGMTYDIADEGTDPGAVTGVKASQILTATDQPVAGETVTVAGTVYTFQVAADAAGEVTIGADLEDSLENLRDAILGVDGLNDVNPYVTATSTATTLTVTAKVFGTAPNSYAVADTYADASWGAATLAGGVTQVSGYTDTDPGDVLNGTNNMGTIRMDGAEATDKFKSITLNIASGARGKDALGIDGNFDVGIGTIAVTGTLNAYFLNNSLPTKIKNHTTFGLEFYLQDAAGNRLYFYLPAVKPSNGDPKITGINSDVMIETGFQAIMDRAVTQKTIIIDAIAA